jgi:hypothetical protein
MQELTRQQVWSMPIEEIKLINNQWRSAIKQHDNDYKPYKDIDKYIVNNHPELAYQFLWESFTPGRREQERSGFNSYVQTTFGDLFQ